MKNVIKLVLSLALLASPFAAFAATLNEQAYIESYRGRTDTPVPLVVVTPAVGSDYIGATVSLDFTVDETGKPTAITAIDTSDALLASRVTDAVAKWQFAPVVRDGKPVAVKVRLPLRIVEQS